MKKILIFTVFLLSLKAANSQVLISLLFGDKLNSPGVEFGLDAGLNWARVASFESNKPFNKLNLGFYFTFRLFKSPNWFLRTGVMVKSDRGIEKLSSNDVKAIDSTFYYGSEGEYRQEIGYFDVPILMRYKFDFKGFIEVGTQLSLKNSAYLYYTKEEGDQTLITEKKNKNDINSFDAGLLLGTGYKFKDVKSVSIAVWYYIGLSDVYKDISGTKSNALTLKITIPIGAGKVEKKHKEKGKSRD